MDKRISSADDAVALIPNGSTIMSGGFGLCGNPENLIAALHRAGTEGLSFVSNNCGTDAHGLGTLLNNKQIVKMTSSYVGENKEFERQFLTGEIEVELVPQGTLAERIRAGGAGIPAFYTATGVGTQVSEGGLPMIYNANGSVKKASPKKEVRDFNGRQYVLEQGLTADFTIIRAAVADYSGNLVFRKTAQNFSSIMAMAGKVTIVEAEQLVPLGEIDPDHVHVPGVYVQHVFQGSGYEKWIEQRTTRPRAQA